MQSLNLISFFSPLFCKRIWVSWYKEWWEHEEKKQNLQKGIESEKTKNQRDVEALEVSP